MNPNPNLMQEALEEAKQFLRDAEGDVLVSAPAYQKTLKKFVQALTPSVPYESFVAALKKPGDRIAGEMTATKASLLHMAVGIAGEAGELLTPAKRVAIYNQSWDTTDNQTGKTNRELAVEELGDLKFYIVGFMLDAGITEQEVEEYNRSKLGKRYAKATYSDAAAHARGDKVTS